MAYNNFIYVKHLEELTIGASFSEPERSEYHEELVKYMPQMFGPQGTKGLVFYLGGTEIEVPDFKTQEFGNKITPSDYYIAAGTFEYEFRPS